MATGFVHGARSDSNNLCRIRITYIPLVAKTKTAIFTQKAKRQVMLPTTSWADQRLFLSQRDDRSHDPTART